ncbi:methyltransferase-like protein 24 [Amphibalanus amphitrite]|uniref:methyltransferase-like protein 24 n=1 Tax=Amphibalanus amphitrite TaxID=1232801 RepID=UPI001C928924|nr:methyltransferase-like protein 24 [Amphibalanus amphitrite]
MALPGQWVASVPWRSVRRNRVALAAALTTLGVGLLTLLSAQHAVISSSTSQQQQPQQPISKRFLPAGGVAETGAIISHLLSQRWRQGAETARALFSYLEQPEPCCQHLGDAGARDPPFCLDPALAPGGRSCLVYSFGLSAELSFERALAARGCEVHAFDPRWPAGEGRGEAGITFHRRALSGENETSEAGWHRATFGQTLRELGHAGRAIDYLRVDVVGAEWTWLDAEEEQALRQVRQLGMVVYFNDLAGIEETSQRNRNYMLSWYYDTFGQLFDLGFCLVSSREDADNPRRRRIPGLAEEKATIWELIWVRR